MISLLSKFRRATTINGSPSRESSPVRTLRNRIIQHATACNATSDRIPAVRHTHTDRNSWADKSQGGSTRYPVICVAKGNCTDKGEPSNRRTFLQAKGG